MTLGNLVSAYMKEHALSYRAFGAKCGVSSGYISMLVNEKNPSTGKPIIPNIVTYNNIANAMNMTIDELFAAIDNAPVSLKASDTDLVEDNGRVTKLITRRIPILGSTAAGAPITAERVYDDFVDIPIDGRRFDAAVRVDGDSMEPLFHKGDLALIRYQPDLEDGEIGVVCIDDTVTLKRIYHVNGGIMLHSENPKYKPMLITENDCNNIHLTGKVIGHLHWLEE